MTDASRTIRCAVEVRASAEDVWLAWTTEEGAAGFFAPECRIDPTPGGAYEMYFEPGAGPGEKGGEGNVVLAVQPLRMLSFTWNAPPHLADVREQRTHVTVRLESTSEGATTVSLEHDGWGEGGDWDRAFGYFARAWSDIVLPRLRRMFEGDPVGWNDPPVRRESGEEENQDD